jgi:hypothetical protein
MKRGDLVRISITVIATDNDTKLCRGVVVSNEPKWIRAIVVEDYTGNKMVKVYVPSTGEIKKYHASQVQIHKRIKENY